ncbi:RNA polymerase sigma factor [Engelhardtia mirabilis]|uniref:RNA polymerase sigma factor n=1 Tax=Engelhardtia mirabilis TaxID=2528011 RepID=UPI003AF37D40
MADSTDAPEPRPEAALDESLNLVRGAQAGDSAALDALFARFYPRVLAIVRRRMGQGLRRHHESLDVAQEAMAEAIRGFDRFELRDETAFTAWLAGIVENRLRDLAKYHRRAKRDAGREVRASSLDPDAIAPPEPGDRSTEATPSELVAEHEQHGRARAALERLPHRQRRAIELRLEGRSWAEVARLLDFPSEGAARMFHSRAMVTLARESGAGGAS